MEPDHPPADVLRLGARGAALAGVFAGAAHILTGPLPAIDLTLLFWALIAGLAVSATVVGLFLPRFEAAAGAVLVFTATVATLAGGGVAFLGRLGWTHGYALLLFGAGLFFLSAWGWAWRDGELRGSPTPVEDAHPEESS